MFRRVLSSTAVKRFYSKGSEKGKIEKITARQIFDSRGFPTVEVDVITEDGLFRAGVPSGASTGTHEVIELRDGEPKDYFGKGVSKAVEKVEKCIGPGIIKKCLKATQQCQIDNFMKELDGTPNMKNLGANAIVGVSIAVCKAGAKAKCLPIYRYIAELAENSDLVMPVPSFNVLNGGVHAGNKLAFQEFMIMPIGAQSFCHAMKMGSETYHHLKELVKCKYGKRSTTVGDEGGFAPDIGEPKEALEIIKEAIQKAGYENEIRLSMDPAASEFHKDKKYDLNFKQKDKDEKGLKDVEAMITLYKSIIDEFCPVSIEDPFDQEHFEAWTQLTCQVDIQIVGDDLLVTNPKRIKMAHEKKACNALLLKLNQIGTVSESIEAFKLCKSYGWGTMISHRSGETEGSFIADLAVGISAGQIKTGAPCRSERLAKYNQLLRIEEELGKDAKYVGENYRKPYKT